MNETDWLAADNPFPLVRFFEPRMTDRQRLLFSAGCCRRIWHLLTDDRLRQLIELAEDCADGKINRAELQAAANALPRPGYRSEPDPTPAIPAGPGEFVEPDPVLIRTFRFGQPSPPLRGGMGIVNFRELPRWCQDAYHAAMATAEASPFSAARDASAEYAFEQASEGHALHADIQQLHDEVEREVRRLEDLRWRGADRQAEEQAAAVREMRLAAEAEVARLRRVISLDADQVRDRVSREERAAQAALFRCVVGNPFRPFVFMPEWRSTTAVGLARTMYESRDFGAMPVLADALEEAGCDDEQVLAHCRGDAPHARGCWVVDGLLGK